MKIEVGKAYRTRGGWKATVDDIVFPGYLRISHDIENINYLFHEKNGELIGGREEDKKYDIIAEWSESAKYCAGDLVMVKLTAESAQHLNHNGGADYTTVDIISHTPAPFDWADVKPGNAFIYSPDGEVWIYSGPWIRLEDSGEYTFNERRAFFQKKGELCRSIDIGFDLLTRAHEHDIEVKS